MHKDKADKILYDVLGAQLEDSDVIDARIDEAYKIIRDRKKSSVWRKVWITCGSTAAVLCLTFLFCVMNPVMAREIPILGTIFAKVADVFPFGNLPEEESSVLHEGESSLYQVKDNGITITLEQEYVSNQALFIGVRMESDEPVPELVDYVENGGQFLTLRTEESYSFRPEDSITTRRRLEGKFENAHTFIGIMRIDFSELSLDSRRYDRAVDEADAKGEEYPEYTDEWADYYDIPPQFEMELGITQIIGTLENPVRPEGMKSEEELAQMSDEEIGVYRNSLPKEWVGFPNKYQHWYQDGEWKFEVSIIQQDEASRVIEVHEVDEKGVGIESIELSAVEMTVNSVNATAEALTTIVFDADGEEIGLAPGMDGGVYAIMEHDISTLYIYLCDFGESSDMRSVYELPENNKSFQELIEECAVFGTVVEAGE